MRVYLWSSVLAGPPVARLAGIVVLFIKKVSNGPPCFVWLPNQSSRSYFQEALLRVWAFEYSNTPGLPDPCTTRPSWQFAECEPLRIKGYDPRLTSFSSVVNAMWCMIVGLSFLFLLLPDLLLMSGCFYLTKRYLDLLVFRQGPNRSILRFVPDDG